MGGATVEPLAVPPAQDRPFVALPDGEIDGAGCARHERDHRGLVALSDDREGPVSALDGEVLDVRAARFGHPQAVEAKQHSQCGVHRVVPLSGEQEGAELGAVHPVPLGLGDLGAADVLGGVGGDATVDVGEPVVATHRGQPPIDRRGRQASLLHRHSVQLDVASGRRQWCHAVVAGPLEEPSGDRAGRRRGCGRCSGPGTRPPPGQPRQDPDSPTRGTRRWWWDRTWIILLHWTTTANATSTARRRRLRARPGPRPFVTALASTSDGRQQKRRLPGVGGHLQRAMTPRVL